MALTQAVWGQPLAQHGNEADNKLKNLVFCDPPATPFETASYICEQQNPPLQNLIRKTCIFRDRKFIAW
jgi:hypothetical protein